MTTGTARDGTTSLQPLDRWPRWLVWVIRGWYGLLSLWALSMARGVVELGLGEAGPGESFGYATVTAWKLLATGGVLVICWTGGRSVVAFQATVVGLVAWSVSEMLWVAQPVDASPVLSTVASLVIWFLPLIALRPNRRELFRLQAHPSAVLLLVAVVAAVPLAIDAQRKGDLVLAPSLAEYHVPSLMTGLGCVLAAQAVFAALRPAGNRWLPRAVALTAAWSGLAAIVWPEDIGSFGTVWGAALIVWACVFAGTAEFESRRDDSG
jgi:hypothetical protein